MATLGPVTLELEQSLRYGETRYASFFRGSSSTSLDIELTAQRASKVNVNLPGASQLVLIDVNSETERVVSSELLWEFSGTAVAEVWTGGTRVGSYRLSLPKVTTLNESIDLKNYIDYQLLVSGKPLIKNVTTSSSTALAHCSTRRSPNHTAPASPRVLLPKVAPKLLGLSAFGRAARRMGSGLARKPNR